MIRNLRYVEETKTLSIFFAVDEVEALAKNQCCSGVTATMKIEGISPEEFELITERIGEKPEEFATAMKELAEDLAGHLPTQSEKYVFIPITPEQYDELQADDAADSQPQKPPQDAGSLTHLQIPGICNPLATGTTPGNSQCPQCGDFVGPLVIGEQMVRSCRRCGCRL